MLIVYDWMREEAEKWYRDNPDKCKGVDRDKVDSFEEACKKAEDIAEGWDSPAVWDAHYAEEL